MARPTRPVLRSLAAAALLLAAACTDDARHPAAPPADALASVSGDPSEFYYHGDERIALELDPTALAVTSAAALPPQASAQAVAALHGVRVRGATRLPHGPYWLLDVEPGSDRQAVRAAARALRADRRFGYAANVYRAAQGGGRVILLDRVAVQLHEGATRADVARLNAEFGTRVVREPQPAEPNLWWLGYPASADVDPLELAARIHRHPLVQWADPDKVQERRRLAVPTDPFYAQQYSLRNTLFRNGYRVDVNAQPAWDLTYGAWAPSAGPLTVAVVDEGVEVGHPDLPSGAFVGYDAFSGTWDSWGCTGCASNPDAGAAHGTNVAGILAAQHNNGLGVAGLAPAVRLFPIRILTTVNGIGYAASDCAIGQALNNAWFNGAQVMNNSWGGGSASSCITSAINSATTQGRNGLGTVMVFAAGNDSHREASSVSGVAYPGSLSNVLTVSALLRDGNVAPYSNGGSAVDVAAFGGPRTPNGDVYSTDLLGSRGYVGGDYFAGFNGTSAAAPQAAAVAAMVLSRNASLTELQVRDRTKAGADPWGTATDFGSGKLNAYRALVGRVNVSISGPTNFSQPGPGTWTANPSGGLGGYTYQWEVSEDLLGWQPLGTSQTQMYGIIENAVIRLRVTVRDSGTDEHKATAMITVRGPVTDDDGNPCPIGQRVC